MRPVTIAMALCIAAIGSSFVSHQLRRGCHESLLEAAAHGNDATIRRLSMIGCVDDGKWTSKPLFEAVVHGNRETALLLLELGADPLDGPKGGSSPLEWAIKHGDEDLALEMLRSLEPGSHPMLKYARRSAEKHRQSRVVAAIDRF